ncbi:gamma carbonic anhydrase family protein [bacterium]|nr:gamma carbonic anhydrase family protein [bacterium]
MILAHHGCTPQMDASVFVAPSADIIGEVSIGPQSSVWFQVVIRGDVNWIKIGSRTNIQDHSMLHVTRRKSPLLIGDEVTIGHRVTLHGCTVGNRVLLGMGAIVLDDAVIGDDWIRPLKQEELAFLRTSAQNYVGDAEEYQRLLNSK